MINYSRSIGLLLLLLCMAMAVQAQITGNVKLADIHNNLLADHSGIVVAFEPQSGAQAVRDTAYTDANGDFSITLSSGLYKVTYYKPGYTKKEPRSSLTIQTPNFNLPNEVLYELLPIVHLYGNLTRTLYPDTNYVIVDTVTIPAGVTVEVPAGAWLSFLQTDTTLSSALVVNGELHLLGDTAMPAVLASISGVDLSLPFSNIFGYDFLGTRPVFINSGAKLIAQNAFVGSVDVRTYQATIEFENVTTDIFNQPWHVFDTIYSYAGVNGSGRRIDPLTFMEIEESTISINESDIHITGDFLNSRVNIDCSYFKATANFLSGCIVAVSNSNIFSPASINNYDGVDSLEFRNNIVWGNMSLKNGLSSGISKFYFTNNSFRQSLMLLSDSIQISFVNNLGLMLAVGSNPSETAITELKYNTLYPNSYFGPNGRLYLEPGPTYPPGVVYTHDHTWTLDTFDIYENAYVIYSLLYFDYNDDFYATTLQDSLAQRYYYNNGDPTILDLDGSRSDRGARYAGCSNPLTQQPAGPIVAVADSVYPGDANYDGVCDNTDLLPIGYLFGETGPVRANASLAWTGQYADPWTATLPNTRNAKHSDCDGDGTVAYPDVNAIYQNYGLTHTVQKQQPFGDGLWLQFPSDSIFEGDTVEVAVMLGTSASPATGIYGLAFGITYDPAFIAPGSARIEFGNSWVGTDSVDMVTFFREEQPLSRYDVALSRTDRQQVSGSGQVGTLIVVVNDDILAKDSLTLTTLMDFVNITAKNASYANTNIGSNYATFNVQAGYDRLPQSVAGVEHTNIGIYPNPAKDRLQLQLPENQLAHLAIYSLDGRKQIAHENATGNIVLDISTLSEGIYVLQLQMGKQMTTYKLIIQH